MEFRSSYAQLISYQGNGEMGKFQLKPQNPKTLKPQNPKTLKPQNPNP